MDISQTKIPKWVVAVIIIVFVAFGIYVVTVVKNDQPDEEGCFRFNGTSSYGWTIDQIYDIDINQSQIIKDDLHNKSHTKLPYEPLEILNEDKALLAYTSDWFIPDSMVNNCMFFFVSPDLSDDDNWQNIAGFSFGIARSFTCSSGEWYRYNVFAEIIAEDESGSEVILFENLIDPEKKSYLHLSALNTPNYKHCLPTELASSEYTIKQVRIGCILNGFNYNPNIKFSGGWYLHYVCPIYK